MTGVLASADRPEMDVDCAPVPETDVERHRNHRKQFHRKVQNLGRALPDEIPLAPRSNDALLVSAELVKDDP